MKNVLAFLLTMAISIGYSHGKTYRKYEFKRMFFYESIELYDDGTFIYHNRDEFLRIKIDGNWQLRTDSVLVLDSRPQTRKMIVFESFIETSNTTFQIRDMDNDWFGFHLYLINEKNDTVKYDGYDQMAVDFNFSSFYIVDTKSLHSPTYAVKGGNVNYFFVLFDTKRSFENEYWKYYGDYIVPIGLDGKYVKYKLELKE